MQQKIVFIIVLVVAFLAAIILGTNIGTADYEQIALYIIVAIGIYFVLQGWKSIWWGLAILSFSMVSFTFSFDFDVRHISVVLIAAASGLSLMNGRKIPVQPPELVRAGSRSVAVILGALLVYAVLHFCVYYVFPYNPTDFSWKSSAKAYFQAFASIFCFAWLLYGSYAFHMKQGWPKAMILIIAFGVIINIAAMTWMFLRGYQAADELDIDPRNYQLFVPIINMMPNIFALRSICPLGLVLTLMIATTPGWWRSTPFFYKLIVVSLIPLIFVGALYSGGRATPIFCGAIAIGVALIRRKIHLVAVMACASILVIAVVNLFSDYINYRAPMSIARSVQIVMLDKNENAYGSITHSQDSRNAAFNEALIQWRRDNRVLFFGRSVFGISKQDMTKKSGLSEMDQFVEDTMRTGATHNLVTDLLLQYGLLGCALYLLGYLAIIRFFWRLHRTIPESEGIAKSITGAIKIYLPLMFIYQLLGGTYLPTEVALCIGLIRSCLLFQRQVPLRPLNQSLPSPQPIQPPQHSPSGQYT